MNNPGRPLGGTQLMNPPATQPQVAPGPQPQAAPPGPQGQAHQAHSPQQQHAQPQQYAPAPQQQYAQPQAQPYAAPQQPPPAQPYGQPPGAYAQPAQQYAQPQPPQQYAQPQPPQQYAPAPQQYAQQPAQHQPQYGQPPQQQQHQQFAQPQPAPAQQYGGPPPHNPAPVSPTIPDATLASNVAIEPGFMPAVRLNLKTLGYTLPSFLYSSALAAVSFAIVAATIGLCAVAFMYVNKYVAGVLMLLGFVPLVLLWVPFTWRKMFSMTAGHVAVMTELINTGGLQRGNDGMFKYGRNVIATRFGDREGFRAFHNRLENMLGHLMKSLDRLDEYVPQLRVVRPYLARLRGLLMRHLRWVVLSYAVARGASSEEQLKLRSLEATCYVVQNGMGLLKTALVVSIIERISERLMWFLSAVAFTLAVFVATYTVGFSQTLPDFSHLDVSMLGSEPLWVSLVAAVVVGPLVGYLVTSAYVEAVLRPFASTMVLLKFHNLIQNQPLKPEWAERIHTGGYAADRFDWLSFKTLR